MNLPTSSLVYRDTAFVSCLEFSKKDYHCDYCFKSLRRFLRCPGCQFMQYCNRNCEKNDLILHAFECNNFKKFFNDQSLKECYYDDFLRLYLRLLIKIKLTNVPMIQNQIERFLSSPDKYENLMLDNERMNQIHHFKQIIKNLMELKFLENFRHSDLISNFGRMLLNKIDILDNNQKIGIGVYIDLYKLSHSCTPNAVKMFDCTKLIVKKIDTYISNNEINISFCDPNLNYWERENFLKINYYLNNCNCIKCRTERIFPDLKFFDEVTVDENLKLAVKIAEKFMSSKTARSTFSEIFLVDQEISQEKIKKVKVIYNEMKGCLGFTDRHTGSQLIHINKKFDKRIQFLNNQLKSNEIQKELEIIIVGIALVIIHEVSHLLFRWKGHVNTPSNLREAGEVLEKKIFYGTVHFLLATENWNENSNFIGLEIKTSDSERLKYLSHEEYINKIYNLNLSDYPNGYVLPIFDDYPQVPYKQALKTSDETIKDKFISSYIGLPSGIFIINKTCGT